MKSNEIYIYIYYSLQCYTISFYKYQFQNILLRIICNLKDLFFFKDNQFFIIRRA